MRHTTEHHWTVEIGLIVAILVVMPIALLVLTAVRPIGWLMNRLWPLVPKESSS